MPRYTEVEAPTGRAWVKVVSGQVINQQTQRWSETKVHSSGGGGTVVNGSGYIKAPTVHSTVTEHDQHEFWLRDDEGLEHHVSLRNQSFRVSPGQRIKVAWGGSVKDKGKGRGRYFFAKNYNSREFFDLNKDEWVSWLSKVGLLRYPILYRLLFYWIPLIYLLGFLVPDPSFHHRLHAGMLGPDPLFLDPVSFFQVHFSSALEFYQKVFASFVAIPSVLEKFNIAMFGGAAVLIVYGLYVGFFTLIGYVVFGRWWQARKAEKFRLRILGIFDVDADG